MTVGPPHLGARYAVGDLVSVRTGDPGHHTRKPVYTRGHIGEIITVNGNWPLADDFALAPEDARVETVYTVQFDASDLWCEGGHLVAVDLWESYLAPVTTGAPRHTA